MNTRRFLYIPPFFFILLICVGISFADHEDPIIFVKSIVEEYIGILKLEESDDIQKEKILNLMRSSFDFSSITEVLLRGLKVDDNNKSTFTNLFPLLLEKRYSIFIKSPNNFSVEYIDYELFAGGSKAIVRTRTKISNQDIDLNYKLHHVDGKWKIYDLTAGNIGLVNNYKAQIQKILKQKSFQDFLTQLKRIVSKEKSLDDR